jgi:hypothetical protein
VRYENRPDYPQASKAFCYLRGMGTRPTLETQPPAKAMPGAIDCRDAAQFGQCCKRSVQPVLMGGKGSVNEDDVLPLTSRDGME